MNEAIPEQHREQWEDVSRELQLASIDLNRAETRYHAALCARLVLRELMFAEHEVEQ